MQIDVIDYSSDFLAFLASLNDQKRADIIRSELNRYAKKEIELDIKECEHFENRNKTVICDAGVIVFFDVVGNKLIIINGSEMPPRAS